MLPVNAVIEFLTFDANNATQKKNIKTGYTKMAGVLHDFESIGLINLNKFSFEYNIPRYSSTIGILLP